MAETTRGTVLRFDPIKGYGFIAPRGGGEDVFMHANDLMDDKSLFESGVTVEFLLEHEGRGPKASFVHVLGSRPHGPVPVKPSPSRVVRLDEDGEVDDDFVDVVPRGEFVQQITERLLTVQPSLTGAQILAVREVVLDYCIAREWVVRG